MLCGSGCWCAQPLGYTSASSWCSGTGKVSGGQHGLLRLVLCQRMLQQHAGTLLGAVMQALARILLRKTCLSVSAHLPKLTP